jgi:hypothetical protein
MSIERWRIVDETVGSGLEPAPNGPWVSFQDHVRAIANATRAGYQSGYSDGIADVEQEL